MTQQEMHDLDAWIAEHVFGWVKMNFNNGYTRHNYLNKTKERANRFRKHDWAYGYHYVKHEPSYTSDSAAAMEVLKKCILKCQNELTFAAPAPFMWKVARLDWDSECCMELQEAETIELAICLFAKELFGKEKK
jgi:hypothetical protein